MFRRRRRTKKRISKRNFRNRKSMKLKYRIYSSKGFVSHI